MSDAMFLVQMATLVGVTWWLVAKIGSLRKSVEQLTVDVEALKAAIKDAVAEAFEEHDDPYPLVPKYYPGPEGMKEYEDKVKDWNERHGR